MAVESLGPRELADIADTIPDDQPATVRPATRAPQRGPAVVVTHHVGGLLAAVTVLCSVLSVLAMILTLAINLR